MTRLIFEINITEFEKANINNQKMRYHIKWFEWYADSFIKGDVNNKEAIKHKKDHSIRVLNNARIITNGINISNHLEKLIHLSALYHDVGRFKQYEEYQTFDDRKSINHAVLSVNILRENETLSELTLEDQSLVFDTISLHNRYLLPPSVGPKLSLSVKVLRDADKLDIINIWITHLSSDSPESNTILLNLKKDPTKYTDAFLEQVLSRRSPKFDNLIWINDYILILCGWLYEINFKTTINVLIQKGYLTQLINLLPKTIKFNKLGKRLEKDLRQKIKNL